MKKAFTIIELIFVIILIGIMSAVVVTSFKTSDDNLALAAHQVVNHIRYTQHLAITQQEFDPKDLAYDPNPPHTKANKGTYFRSWWQMRFVVVPATNAAPSIVGYAIYSDSNRLGNININTAEAAINPTDGLRLSCMSNQSNSPDTNIGNKYGITNISFSANCQSNDFSTVTGRVGTIVFDEKGRPYDGIANNNANNPYQYILSTPCTITLTGDGGRTATITVTPETGYAQITAIN